MSCLQEVFGPDGYSTPADIWSFGCTVLEMVTGVIPWSLEFTDFYGFVYALTHTDRVPAIPDGSAELKDFIRLCLTRYVMNFLAIFNRLLLS